MSETTFVCANCGRKLGSLRIVAFSTCVMCWPLGDDDRAAVAAAFADKRRADWYTRYPFRVYRDAFGHGWRTHTGQGIVVCETWREAIDAAMAATPEEAQR